jgi:hypothetical protein
MLEVEEKRTTLSLILMIADVELRRWGNVGRRIYVLSPFPVHLQTSIASRGLNLPDLDTSLILENLIEQSHA